jgi:DNA-binding NtrC family response regulator
MGNSPPEEAIKFATFGRRKVAPRVCIADGKRHIRKFLGEALEELGFITRECTQVGELSALLDGQVPDLVIVGCRQAESTRLGCWKRSQQDHSTVGSFCLAPATP